MADRPNQAPSASNILALARTEEFYKTFRTGIRTLGVILGIYWGRDIVSALAGQWTRLDIQLLADLKFALTLTLAGAAAAWACVERWLRHRKVERLQGRIRELETGLDPDRTSSGLTPKGQTHPKDKD